mgnify:CR=1 FL=1
MGEGTHRCIGEVGDVARGICDGIAGSGAVELPEVALVCDESDLTELDLRVVEGGGVRCFVFGCEAPTEGVVGCFPGRCGVRGGRFCRCSGAAERWCGWCGVFRLFCAPWCRRSLPMSSRLGGGSG